MHRPMTVAVVGCGAISDIYLKNMMGRFANLQVRACCAAHLESAKRKAAQYGIIGCTYAEILANPDIEMVVVLTPAPTHYSLIKQALLAGKHVYTEKTMTLHLEEARELMALADEKGLYLGCAPDTFLGAAWQRARQVIDDGVLGEITSFSICVNRNVEALTDEYQFLNQPGGGICYDYGVYHLSALVSLLGPVAEVSAMAQRGKTFRYDNESLVTAVLRTESGICGTFSLNGESIRQDLCQFMIYGTKGVLRLTDPNRFGGELSLILGRDEQYIIENDLPYADNSRGLGPAEMVCAIREGRINLANKNLAFHVLEIIDAMVRSAENRSFVAMHSTCARPEPLDSLNLKSIT